MSLKSYVIETFDKVADLSEERLAYLNTLLDRINASKYTKQQFCEEMGVDDINFFSLLAMLFDDRNNDRFVEFGNKFNTVEEQISLS